MNNQLTPYCRRPDNDEKQEEISYIFGKNIANNITFKELSEQGITSEQLLNWSAPIDLVERYEMNSQTSELFYNCSSSWFGSKCQYRFVYNSFLSFNEIVKASLNIRQKILHGVSVTTCYRFLSDCHRGPWSLCLDWRQIFNGIVDCKSGKDEQWCETLEMTICADDEYRCHYGGQCIPRIFARDSYLSVDCLDGSDEKQTFSIHSPFAGSVCGSIITFRCEERINRYPLAFPCGDGEFLPKTSVPHSAIPCSNRRDDEMTKTMLTSLDHIQDINCRQAFRCSLLSDRPSRLILPEYPVMYGYFQFVYLTNRSTNEFKINVGPDFVCFDAQKCSGLLSRIVPIKIIDGLTCCRTFDLINEYPRNDFNMLNYDFSRLYDECSTMGNEISCTNSSYFHCNESLKCISYHRVGDGFRDCFYNEDELFPACHLNVSNRFSCTSDPTKCLSLVAIDNGQVDCPQREDEIHENI
ncbi:unnamed protein product [Rotaria sp. Silwood2]|nr:unnamed protein product [Rotaria sp. Silwood2]CAF3180209.1 unnamed protein product [Rotaria sp. Silwood2]CAF3891732.1 unnamed protein product [Rotaria sp. Silwood2]CAF4045243.1 unnamed protein product [Rotaria sp. Silwood2]